MDETKIIAAILCAQTILLEDVASDPIGKTVNFYERVLAELRSREHGGPTASPLLRAGKILHSADVPVGEPSEKIGRN